MFNSLPVSSARNYSTLYIGDLEEQITEEMLYSIFIKFGPIFSLRIMKDFNSKKSRGFGFVSYYNVSDAKNAKQTTNHSIILTKPIRISWKKHLKDMSADNNIFVKNISKNVTEREFEEFFTQFGQVFSSKISYDEKGESRGYGYVQFEDKESTEKCLSQSKNLILGDSTLEVIQFNQKNDRQELNSNNLYIKNLPQNDSQLQEKLKQICQRYGEVTSIIVKIDTTTNLPYSFVCYQNHAQAQEAYNVLSSSDPFNIGSNLYVNWAQKKSDRLRQLKNLYQNSKNETNIFSRNVKTTVTKQQLDEAFSAFGEIQNSSIKDPQNQKYSTLMGFINFKSKESAMACLMGAQTSEKIKNLYLHEKVYVNLHVPKTQHQSLDRMRGRGQPMMMDQMKMMQQVMMGMGMQNPQQQNMMMQMMQGMNMGMNMGMPMGMNMGMPMNMSMGQNLIPTARNGRNLPARGFGGGFQKQGFPNQTQNVQKVQQEKKQFADVVDIRNNLSDFTKLNQDKQRSYLGEILFPMVQEIIRNKEDVPRVTGMLVDFEVFELTDILEILENKEQLVERVGEAEALIQEERQQG